ncbi:uncharacterized protein [Phaseolus vulgaris]|uniref:uncharacterized protein n=1 Tax=Phaseolus vulgaris TaxID=3885 RepID=UPI0035CB7462
MALSAKNKVEFVNGAAPQPSETDSSFSSWTRCNNMVASWLVHSVSVHIRQSIIWMDKALDIWNDLKAHFSQGDLSRISDLQMEASSLNQGDLSVTNYFSKLRIIWDELDNFRPDLKNGFPDQDNRGSNFGSNKKVCTYCNKIGHTIDVFYKKHGYPLGYRSQYGKSSQSNNISTTIQEENSGNQDQNKQNNKGDFRITQHQYQILLDLLKNVNNSNNQVQVNQVGPLSADHQDQNLAVTSNIEKLQNSNFNEYTWIIDFGATDHNSRTKDKIGTIDFVVGLYVFNKTDSRIMSCTAKQSNIWNLRMGNP